MDEWSVSLQRMDEHISATPIENQLSIYYFWCGDHNEARGKEFISKREGEEK